MPIAQLDDINLYYEESGTGAPLIFVPGLGGNTDLWKFQALYFQNHFRTIVLDNRGAGRSDKPAGPYSMEIFARDLNRLLDHLGINEPVNLVGASMGGIIAQAFIHDYPHRVKKLALACSGVSGGDPHITLPDEHVQRRLANPGDTQEERVNTIFEIFYHPEFVARFPQLKQLFLQKKIEPQPPHAYQGQLAACADPRPYYQWLSEIRVPTLVIHGREDRVWPLQNALTLMEGLGPKGQLTILDGAAHILMQEKAEEFNRRLHDFLNQQ